MSIFKNAITASLGLEDDAPNVQVNIDTDETGMPIDNVTEEGENTPEADEVEIIEDTVEIEADNEVIEEMTEAADSLESIFIAMESAQSNGGMTPEAARFASIAVANIVGKYGVSSEDMGISLESFNDNRAHATTVSMEGVGQALKDLWEAIVAKFHAMVKKIVDFYHKMIAAAPRIKRRAEALRKKARAVKGSPKEKTMKTSLFGALNIAGSVPTAADLKTALKELHMDVSTNKKKAEIVDKAQQIFAPFNGAGEDGGADGVATNIATAMGFGGIAGSGSSFALKANSVTAKVGGSNAGVAVGITRNLPGNKMAFLGTITGTDRGSKIEALRDVRVGIYTDNDSYKADKTAEREKEWPILGTGDIETLCDLVIKNMEDIIADKTQADKKLNAVKLTKKEGEKLINKIDGDNKAKAQANATKVLNIVTDVMRQADQGRAQFTSYQYRASKSVLAYCARSLSQYKSN